MNREKLKNWIENHEYMDEYKSCVVGAVDLEIAIDRGEFDNTQNWTPISEYKGFGIYVPVLWQDGNGNYFEEWAYYDNRKESWMVDDTYSLPTVTHYFKLPKAPNKITVL